MKPKSRRSIESNPAEAKRLSTCMKPSLRSKSNETIANCGQKKSPLADQLLSASKGKGGLNRTFSRVNLQERLSSISRQRGTVNLIQNRTECSSHSSSNLHEQSCQSSIASSNNSSIMMSSLRRSTRIRRQPPTLTGTMTPKIMVTKCEKLERLVEEKEEKEESKLSTNRKVLRSKVKSPVNKIQRSAIERNQRNKERIESYEAQLRKKESEILSLNRKVNNLQKIVSDKEKSIKGLELKFPKMIAELKHGLLEEKRANIEMKEVFKRYRQASGEKRQMEDQLKAKDDKLKDLKMSNKSMAEELKSKIEELSSFRARLFALEEKVPKLVDEIHDKEREIMTKDEDLTRYEETVEFLEQRLEAQLNDQRTQEKLIDDLKRKLNECCEEIDTKENEINILRATNNDLYEELQEQYEALEKTDQETKNYLQIIDSIREKIDVAPGNVEKLHSSIDYLDKATEDFLDKVSSVSKKKNMSFKVKLTIRKGKRGSTTFSNGNETYDSIIVNTNALNNNSTRLSFNNIVNSSRKVSQDNIFKLSQSRTSSISSQSRVSVDGGRKHRRLCPDPADEEDEVFVAGETWDNSIRPRSSQGSVTSLASVNTEASKSEYDLSSDTAARLEDLDTKVQSLWHKLSTKDDSYEAFKSSTKPHFTSSVSKMKNELTESIERHNRLLSQVHVAKKLFNSPTPVKKI